MATNNARWMMAAGLAAAFATGGCIIVVDGTNDGDWHHAYHDGPRAERTWTTDIDAALLGETDGIWVKTRAGDVVIEHTDGPARVEVHARGPDAERVALARVSVVRSGDTLRIEPKWPDSSWRSSESVDLTIAVPRREGVEVLTSAGDVEIEAMAGPLRVETSAGDVKIQEHDGPARIETSAGDIWMEHVSGDIEAETSAGDIDLFDVGWPIEAITSAGDVTAEMRPGFSGVLHAATTTGDLRMPPGGEIRRSGSKKSASVEMGDDGSECVFKTSSGDISVRVRSE